MWRQRFGLDASALEKAKRCLAEPTAWTLSEEDGYVCYHHDVFPEFTLKAASAEEVGLDSSQEWTRGEIRTDNNHAGWYELRCHQTLLRRIHYVSFDDNKKSIVAPDWRAIGRGRFYFYQADSIRYAVQRFWTALQPRDDSKGSTGTRRRRICQPRRGLDGAGTLDIPVLNPGELEGFPGRASGERHRCQQPSYRPSRAIRTLPPQSARLRRLAASPNGVMEENRRSSLATPGRVARDALTRRRFGSQRFARASTRPPPASIQPTARPPSETGRGKRPWSSRT